MKLDKETRRAVRRIAKAGNISEGQALAYCVSLVDRALAHDMAVVTANALNDLMAGYAAYVLSKHLGQPMQPVLLEGGGITFVEADAMPEPPAGAPATMH